MKQQDAYPGKAEVPQAKRSVTSKSSKYPELSNHCHPKLSSHLHLLRKFKLERLPSPNRENPTERKSKADSDKCKSKHSSKVFFWGF
jgi:hypothetical protein